MEWVIRIVEQLASCFIGEAYSNWKIKYDNRKRLGVAVKVIDSLLEAEKNTAYYDDLDRILTNSSLIEDFALKVEPFDSDRLAKRIEQRINADTKIPYVNKRQVAEVLLRIFHEVHRIILEPDSPEEKRNAIREEEKAAHFDKRLDDLERKFEVSFSKEVDRVTVEKVLYSQVENYLPRKLLPRDVVLEDEWMQYLSNDKKVSLHEAVFDKHLILLLGEAGQGKSTELAHLAYELSDSSYYPFLYKLRYYTNERIVDLLPKGYAQLPQKELVLIFDGYDELDVQLAGEFRKKIILYSQQNPETKIIVSSRSNFCRIEKSSKSSTFPEFSVYSICKLTLDDIRQYLKEHGIEPVEFEKAASASKVMPLISNAFYLTKLVSLYEKTQGLPAKAGVMDKLIEESFNFDDGKYSQSLEDDKRKLFLLLSKVAFAMQLTQKSAFDDEKEYQYLFESATDRDLLKHSGLLEKQGEKWQFSHNNFREYLTAKYLAGMKQEDVLSFISSHNDIKPSWLNTVGYLAGFDLPWLHDWVKHNAPETFVKFEPDRVDGIDRYNVFVKIFTKYEEECLWFDEELCTIEELALFSQSAEALDFLLGRITKPVHHISQYIAINILRYYEKLFGNRDVVRAALIECCKIHPDTRKDVCRLAIHALVDLKLNNEETTAQLFEIFGENTEDYIRLGMYEYLINTNQHNEYVDYFLQGMSTLEPFMSSVHERISNERHILVEGLKIMNTPESVYKVLSWCISDEHNQFYHTKEIFEKVAKTASEMYPTAEYDSYEIILEIFIQRVKNYHMEDAKICFDYFVATGQSDRAIIMSLERIGNDIIQLSNVWNVHPEIFETIVKLYESGQYNNHDMFKKIIEWYVVGEEAYTRCVQLLHRRTGIEMPPYEVPAKYKLPKENAAQVFFDLLFSREKIEILFGELVTKLESDEVRAGDFDRLMEVGDYNTPIHSLAIAIYHSNCRDVLVKDYFHVMPFDAFVLIQSMKYLRNKRVVAVDNQKLHLQKIVRKLFADGILTKNPEQSEGIDYAHFDLIEALAFLAQYFDIELCAEQMLDLTLIPAEFFSQSDNARKYDYLCSHLSKEALLMRIEKNLQNTDLDSNIVREHIEFCMQERSDVAERKALEICTSANSDSYDRQVALEYLHKLHDSQYIVENILPYASGEFLLMISLKCKDASGDELRTALEKEYGVNPSVGLMVELISLKSEVGINGYVKEVSEKHGIPNDWNIYETSTRLIAGITTPMFLPQLTILFELSNQPDFRDNGFYSLRSSVADALIGCGRYAPEEVIELVKKHCPEIEGYDQTKHLCHYIINSIESNQKKATDIAIDLPEAKRIVEVAVW